LQQATSFAYTSSKRSPVTSLTVQPKITYEFCPDWYLGSNQSTWKFNLRKETSTTIPFSAGLGRIWRLEEGLAINGSLSAEWMLYRQFAPQEEQFSLIFQVTLLLPKFGL
jgi:hypothetical protein